MGTITPSGAYVATSKDAVQRSNDELLEHASGAEIAGEPWFTVLARAKAFDADPTNEQALAAMLSIQSSFSAIEEQLQKTDKVKPDFKGQLLRLFKDAVLKFYSVWIPREIKSPRTKSGDLCDLPRDTQIALVQGIEVLIEKTGGRDPEVWKNWVQLEPVRMKVFGPTPNVKDPPSPKKTSRTKSASKGKPHSKVSVPDLLVGGERPDLMAMWGRYNESRILFVLQFHIPFTSLERERALEEIERQRHRANHPELSNPHDRCHLPHMPLLHDGEVLMERRGDDTTPVTINAALGRFAVDQRAGISWQGCENAIDCGSIAINIGRVDRPMDQGPKVCSLDPAFTKNTSQASTASRASARPRQPPVSKK